MPPKKTKPNKPCPCGSGKKHKKCCMIKNQMTTGAGKGRGTTARIPSAVAAVAASTPIIENPPDQFATLEYLAANLGPYDLVMLKDGSSSHQINTIWPSNVQFLSDNNFLARSYQHEWKNKKPGHNDDIVARSLARWRLVAFNHAVDGRESGFFEVRNPAAVMHRFLGSVVLEAPAEGAATSTATADSAPPHQRHRQKTETKEKTSSNNCNRMSTKRNNGTNKISEATLYEILASLEIEEEDGGGGRGGSSHIGNGGNRNNPNNNSENENENKKAATSLTSSSTGTDVNDDDGGGTGYATKNNTRTVFSSSLPVTSSTLATSTVTEHEAAAILPSPSSSVKTLSEVRKKAAIAMTTRAAAFMMTTMPGPTMLPSMLDTQEECVLCAYPRPLEDNESFYFSCCGETICNGCIIGQKRVLVVGTNVELPIKGSKAENREFLMMLLSDVPMLCPFCRAEVPHNTEESLERRWIRINKYEDPEAMVSMGHDYMKGAEGLSKNLAKAEQLFKQAYDLGSPDAANCLSELYSEHIPDQARMMKYTEEGARRGHSDCILLMANCLVESGNFEDATQLWMTAARSGRDEAIHNLMVSCKNKLLSKDDLTTTLHAHKAANERRKNEPREYAIRHYDLEEKFLSRGILGPK